MNGKLFGVSDRLTKINSRRLGRYKIGLNETMEYGKGVDLCYGFEADGKKGIHCFGKPRIHWREAY